jgi:hypothetical protein
MAVYTISGRVNGRWQFQDFQSIRQAVQVVDEWHGQGAKPVHIKRDGILMEDADELDRLIAEEGEE